MEFKHFNVYGLLLLAIYAAIFYQFGMILGYPVIILLMNLFEFVMRKCFNLKLISGSDVWLYLEDDNNYHNCTWANIVDKKFTLAKIRDEMIIPKVVTKFDEFRMSVKHLFGMYFWVEREATPEVIKAASKQIKLIDEKMENLQDIQEFMQRITAWQIPRDDFQWEVFVKENYQGDKTIIIWNIHHALVDGMGGLLLNVGINGCLTEEYIPQMKDASIFTKIFLTLLCPILSTYCLYADYTVKVDPNPFKGKNGYTGKKNLYYSKQYEFSDLR